MWAIRRLPLLVETHHQNTETEPLNGISPASHKLNAFPQKSSRRAAEEQQKKSKSLAHPKKPPRKRETPQN